MTREVLERVVEALKNHAGDESEAAKPVASKSGSTIIISGVMHGDIIDASNLKITIKI